MHLMAALKHASRSIIFHSTVNRRPEGCLDSTQRRDLHVSHCITPRESVPAATSELSHFKMDSEPYLCRRRRPCIVRSGMVPSYASWGPTCRLEREVPG